MSERASVITTRVCSVVRLVAFDKNGLRITMSVSLPVVCEGARAVTDHSNAAQVEGDGAKAQLVASARLDTSLAHVALVVAGCLLLE